MCEICELGEKVVFCETIEEFQQQVVKQKPSKVFYCLTNEFIRLKKFGPFAVPVQTAETFTCRFFSKGKVYMLQTEEGLENARESILFSVEEVGAKLILGSVIASGIEKEDKVLYKVFRKKEYKDDPAKFFSSVIKLSGAKKPALGMVTDGSKCHFSISSEDETYFVLILEGEKEKLSDILEKYDVRDENDSVIAREVFHEMLSIESVVVESYEDLEVEKKTEEESSN